MSRLAPKRFALAHEGKTTSAPGSAETQPKALRLEVVRSR
jgi:hypothetical protein